MEVRKKIRVGGRGFNNGFQMPASKAKSEKVDATVNTFLYKASDRFQAPTSKVGLKKVYATVDTF
ncbi:hypothetical protein [Emticicia fontis]